MFLTICGLSYQGELCSRLITIPIWDVTFSISFLQLSFSIRPCFFFCFFFPILFLSPLPLVSLCTEITTHYFVGDLRMKFGENPAKVANIVKGNLAGFQHLYRPLLATTGGLNQVGPGQLEQDKSPATIKERLGSLPLSVQRQVLQGCRQQCKVDSEQAALDRLSMSVDAAPLIRAGLSGIVQRSSSRQTLVGLLTAGPLKSARYAAEKVLKTLENTQPKLFSLFFSRTRKDRTQ